MSKEDLYSGGPYPENLTDKKDRAAWHLLAEFVGDYRTNSVLPQDVDEHYVRLQLFANLLNRSRPKLKSSAIDQYSLMKLAELIKKTRYTSHFYLEPQKLWLNRQFIAVKNYITTIFPTVEIVDTSAASLISEIQSQKLSIHNMAWKVTII